MSTIATLAVKLQADTSHFQKDMKNAQQSADEFGKRTSRLGGTLTKGLTAPIVGAAGAAIGLAKNWASTGDEIAKTSSKLGITTDALQEMEYWASQNGMESATLERAVGRLNQRIGRAADGNEKYADAFAAVDVATVDAQGNIRDTEAVMQDTIGALRDIEEPAERSAKASEIFGTKMARDLMPALEDGSMSLEEATKRAHELGAVMGEDSIRAAEDFEDAWDDTKRMLMGVVHELGAELLPLVTETLIPALQEHLIPLVREWGERIGGLIDWFKDLSPVTQKYVGIAVGLAAALGPILLVVGKIISVMSPLVGAFKALGAAKLALLGPIGAVVAAIAGAVAIFMHLWKTNEDFRDFIINAWETIKNTAVTVWDAIVGAIRGFIDFFRDAWGENEELVGDLIETWEHLKEVAGLVFEGIKIIIETVTEGIRILWEAWGDDILAVARFAWDQVKIVVETAINILKDTIGLVLAIIRGDWEEAWNRIVSITETLWDGIKATAENFWNLLKDLFGEGVQSIIDWFKELPGKVMKYVRQLVTDISGAWGWLFDVLVGNSIVPDMMEMIEQEFESGMKQAGEAVEEEAERMEKSFEDLAETMINETEIMAEAITSGHNKIREELSLTRQIQQQEYELMRAEVEGNITSMEELRLESEHLREEQVLQEEAVKAAKEAYELMKEEKGKNAEVTQELYLEYIEEKTELQKLTNEIEDTEKSMKELREEREDNISSLEKELRKMQDNRTETERLKHEKEELRGSIDRQREAVEAAEEQYLDMIRTYGEGTEASRRAYEAYLEEQIALQGLKGEYDSVKEAIDSVREAKEAAAATPTVSGPGAGAGGSLPAERFTPEGPDPVEQVHVTMPDGAVRGMSASHYDRYADEYATGGIVPGPPDVARPAIVHGGEEITPRRKANQGRHETTNITIYLDGEVIARAIGEPLTDEIIVRTGLQPQ